MFEAAYGTIFDGLRANDLDRLYANIDRFAKMKF